MDTVPETTRLTIVITSRTFPNVKTAIAELKEYYNKTHFSRPALIEFDYVCFDLASMVSLASAVRELEIRFSKIDYLFLNASLALYDGINWSQACIDTLKDPYEAFTYAHYKKQRPVKPSIDGMGSVFQANVFAPWYLIRRLTARRQTDPSRLEVASADTPLLGPGSKVFWVSSLTADNIYTDPFVTAQVPDSHGGKKKVEQLRFDTDDMELLHTPESYEASKREIDLLHHATAQMFKDKYGVTSILVQPGIFKSTSFTPTLNVFAYFGMMLAFYLCRWIWGSQYHNIDPWKAAYAFVELAKDSPDPTVFKPAKSFVRSTSEKPDTIDLFVKYGSATNRKGESYVLKENVPGWDNGFTLDGFSESDAQSFASQQEAGGLLAHNPNSTGQGYKIYLYVEALYKKWEEKLQGQVIERYLF